MDSQLGDRELIRLEEGIIETFFEWMEPRKRSRQYSSVKLYKSTLVYKPILTQL